MEKQKGINMIMSWQENMEICEWLIEKGLSLEESALVIGDMEGGDTFAHSILKVFTHRKKKMEEIYAKYPTFDWGNPVTP